MWQRRLERLFWPWSIWRIQLNCGLFLDFLQCIPLFASNFARNTAPMNNLLEKRHPKKLNLYKEWKTGTYELKTFCLILRYTPCKGVTLNSLSRRTHVTNKLALYSCSPHKMTEVTLDQSDIGHGCLTTWKRTMKPRNKSAWPAYGPFWCFVCI